MKCLVTYDTSLINQENAEEWGVEKVLTSDELSFDISKLPQLKQSLVFFVPTVCDYRNSLLYDGANLALRILMYYVRDGRTDVDIVLMGNESETDFLLQYDYPNILKIPGFYYARFNKKNIANFTIPNRKQIKRDEYRNYLDNLGLKMPLSFKSTHSLTNEWCLYKWNSFMEFKEDISALEHHLYFDYLITIVRLNKVKDKKATDCLKERIKKLSEGTRILLIEDKEGWHKFFKELFKDSMQVDVHCIGLNFNKLQLFDIEKKIKDEVDKFNPHVIILDFRLMEDRDAEINDDMKQISGYKVLSKVLKGDYETPCDSFGRQVLIFTATSRIENILLLKEGNADGFILKERPENYNGKEITKDLIPKMISTLEEAVDRAKFLIPLNEKLNSLTKYIHCHTINMGKDLMSTILDTAKFVRQLTQNNNLKIEILKLAFLNIFNVFEVIKRDSNYVDYSNDFTLIVKGNNNLIVSGKSKCGMSSRSLDDWNYKPSITLSSSHEKHCKDRSLNFAICALILFRLGYKEVDETDWNTIRLIRNAIAHGETEKLKNKGIDLNLTSLQDYTLKMLDLINTIIDPNNIREVIPQLKI